MIIRKRNIENTNRKNDSILPIDLAKKKTRENIGDLKSRQKTIGSVVAISGPVRSAESRHFETFDRKRSNDYNPNVQRRYLMVRFPP